VFEAVNAITGDYEPYIGITAPAGASLDAAAATAAYTVLKNYFAAAADIDQEYMNSMNAIPNGLAKTSGIDVGKAAGRVVLREVSLQLLASGECDSIPRRLRQPEDAARSSVRAVHHHAVLSQLSVKPRQREQRCGRNPRVYGEGGHTIKLTNPFAPAPVANLEFDYSTFNEVCDDVDDARVFGGIHYRFDQVAGNRLGREIATMCTNTICGRRTVPSSALQ